MGASADATTSTGKLLLATSLTNINANDVLGKIDFQAPHEAGGTDAITVAASIRAIAQSTFSSSSNATDLIFYTGHSEAAAEKVRITSQNEIGIAGANYGTDGQVLTSGGAGAAVAWEDAGGVSTLGGLTDVTMDATNFADSILIQTDSDGSAPSTGTLSSAADNVGIGGGGVMSALTSGTRNVCIGHEAGKAITSPSNNVFIGPQAGLAVTTSGVNVAIGDNALMAHTTSDSGTDGYNVAIGPDALDSCSTGYQNTAIGRDAGQVITTGYRNVNVGVGCNGPQGGNNNIAIGYDVGNAAAEVDGIVIGNGFTPGANSRFSFGKASNVVYNNFDSDANWTRSSDERIKRNIQNDTLGLDFINDLRTVTFQWKDSREVPEELYQSYNAENKMNMDITMHGLVAQEVKAALDTAGVSTFGGWGVQNDGTQSVSREMFVIPLIKAVNELSAKVDALTARVTTLEG